MKLLKSVLVNLIFINFSLITVSLSKITQLKLAIECDEDIVGIVCAFPGISEVNISLEISSVISRNRLSVDTINRSQVIEIKLRNVSKYLPQRIGDHFFGIENLIIHSSSLKYIKRSDFVGSLRQLEVLSLFNNIIESIPHDTFHDLVHLRHLDIENNYLTSLHPQLLINAVNLRVFAASSNQIVYIPASLFENKPNLWKISLSGNKISSFMFDIDKNVNNSLNLRLLDLRHNQGDCNLAFAYPQDVTGLEYKIRIFQLDIESVCIPNEIKISGLKIED